MTTKKAAKKAVAKKAAGKKPVAGKATGTKAAKKTAENYTDPARAIKAAARVSGAHARPSSSPTNTKPRAAATNTNAPTPSRA